jgi:hypothetical protein
MDEIKTIEEWSVLLNLPQELFIEWAKNGLIIINQEKCSLRNIINYLIVENSKNKKILKKLNYKEIKSKTNLINQVYDYIKDKKDKGASQSSLYKVTTPKIRNKQELRYILDDLIDSHKIKKLNNNSKRDVKWIAL